MRTAIDCTEICPDLGACCRIFCAGVPSGKDATRKILSEEPYPFKEVGETEGSLLLTCPSLQSDGKCSQYETRPPTCSSFQPYTDALCCLFVGPPGPQSIAVTHQELITKSRHSNIPPASL